MVGARFYPSAPLLFRGGRREELGIILLDSYVRLGTRFTRTDEVLYRAAHVGEVEVAAKVVYSVLHTLMVILVYSGQDLLQQWRCRRNVQASVKGHHVVNQ
jgi:hypothetical protein